MATRCTEQQRQGVIAVVGPEHEIEDLFRGRIAGRGVKAFARKLQHRRRQDDGGRREIDGGANGPGLGDRGIAEFQQGFAADLCGYARFVERIGVRRGPRSSTRFFIAAAVRSQGVPSLASLTSGTTQ